MNRQLMAFFAPVVILYYGYLAYEDPKLRDDFGRIAYVCVCYWSRKKDDDKNKSKGDKWNKDDENGKDSKK